MSGGGHRVRPPAGGRRVPAAIAAAVEKRLAQRHVGPAGATRAQADAALAEVGLSHRAEAWPATLSGGEAQRAALARALLRSPGLLLLDEPFAALDALTRLKMHSLVLALWARHRPATLLVTHDVEEAVALADRVLVLDRGRIALDEPNPAARPRSRAGAEFGALRTRLLDQLGVHEGIAA